MVFLQTAGSSPPELAHFIVGKRPSFDQKRILFTAPAETEMCILKAVVLPEVDTALAFDTVRRLGIQCFDIDNEPMSEIALLQACQGTATQPLPAKFFGDGEEEQPGDAIADTHEGQSAKLVTRQQTEAFPPTRPS